MVRDLIDPLGTFLMTEGHETTNELTERGNFEAVPEFTNFKSVMTAPRTVSQSTLLLQVAGSLFTYHPTHRAVPASVVAVLSVQVLIYLKC